MTTRIASTGRTLRAAAALCGVLLLAGCASTASRREKVYPPGATVEVGSLTYSVSNPVWTASLNGEHGPRVPSHRFLILTVSASNRLSEPATIPLLTLVDGEDRQYLESDNGEGLSNWMGLLRRIEGHGTEGGEVVFDVPAGKGPYRLRVSSGGEVEKEITALIEVQDEKSSGPAGPLSPASTP